MTGRGWLVASAVVVALAVTGGRAGADERADAERFYRVGETAYRRHSYAAAAENFDEAYRRLPLPDIAFSAAQAHRLQYYVDRDRAHVTRAIELYKAYLDLVKQGEQVGDAAQNLAELEAVLRELGAAPDVATVPIARVTELAVIVDIDETPRVTVDGTAVDVFKRVQVTPGAHVVKVDATGYVPWEKKVIAIDGGYTPVEVPMKERAGTIQVETERGARIRVDGRLAGTAPLAGIEVEPGDHVVEITRRGRVGVSHAVKVARATSVTVNSPLVATGRRRSVRWVLVAGGALVLAAGVTGTVAALASSEAHDLDDRRMTTGISSDELARYDTLADRRDTFLLLTGGLLGLGLAAGATAFGLYWFDNPEAAAPVTPVVTPDGAGIVVSGRF